MRRIFEFTKRYEVIVAVKVVCVSLNQTTNGIAGTVIADSVICSDERVGSIDF